MEKEWSKQGGWEGERQHISQRMAPVVSRGRAAADSSWVPQGADVMKTNELDLTELPSVLLPAFGLFPRDGHGLAV